MALLSSFSSSPRPSSAFQFHHLLSSAPASSSSSSSSNSKLYFTYFNHRTQSSTFPLYAMPASSPNICTGESPKIDTSLLTVAESFYEDELLAAANLRVRSFHDFHPDTFGVQDHMMYLTEREFEALKERVSGKRASSRRVSCINASLPESYISSISKELCSACKFSADGEYGIVVGTLDLNQCLSLPDEIVGMKPEVIGSDVTRAYLSNVCVAKELQRNGLGYALLEKAKIVAREWDADMQVHPDHHVNQLFDLTAYNVAKYFYPKVAATFGRIGSGSLLIGITDLYVHVAVDNEPARKLYLKSGFVYETDEPVWQARFLDRPRRLLLWLGL